MPVTNQTPIGGATGNGVTTVFPFSYYIAADTDLVVKIEGVTKTLGVDYTVSGAGNLNGGTITMSAAPANGARLAHYRDTQLKRDTDYQDNGDFLADMVNLDFDRLWLALQEIFSGGKGAPTAVRVPAGETVDELPAAADRAGRLVGFDSLGRLIATLPTAGDATALALDIANSAALNKGAGQVGFGLAVAYPTNTVGSQIQTTAQEVVDINSDLDSLTEAALTPTPTGESQGSLNDLLRAVASGPRDAIIYENATSVRLARSYVTMGGFRYRGHYTKGRAPTFAMPASKVVSTSADLGAESSVRTENWYAVFACADSGGAVSLKLMPFLRAGTVSGSNVPLIKAGEAVHALTATTYAWGASDNLSGVECLVITEGGEFSGRVTTITANVAGQVTLEGIGSVAAYDFLLPAPPGFDHFCYLGCFYFDTAEVRNIADAGMVVKAKMVNLADPNFTTSGAIGAAVRLRFGGYISPLATAVVLKDTHTLSTASTGNHAGYFWHDSSSHTIQENLEQKTSTGNETAVWDGIELPFSQWQDIWYSTGGSLAATRASATLEIKGWIEP